MGKLSQYTRNRTISLRESNYFIAAEPKLASNSNECLCVRLRIDQMSIKIESSRNITNVSAIDLKVRIQMATSVRLQIDQMSIVILMLTKYYKRVSCIYPKVRLQMATSVYVSDFKLIKCQLNLELKKYYNRISCICPKVRLKMATSVYVSDSKLIKR